MSEQDISEGDPVRGPLGYSHWHKPRLGAGAIIQKPWAKQNPLNSWFCRVYKSKYLFWRCLVNKQISPLQSLWSELATFHRPSVISTSLQPVCAHVFPLAFFIMFSFLSFPLDCWQTVLLNMGEGVGFGGSGRVPCRGADTVWSHGLSVELLGPSQHECACQLLWWGWNWEMMFCALVVNL